MVSSLFKIYSLLFVLRGIISIKNSSLSSQLHFERVVHDLPNDCYFKVITNQLDSSDFSSVSKPRIYRERWDWWDTVDYSKMSGSSFFYIYSSYGNKIQDAKSKFQLAILLYYRPKYDAVSFNHEKQVIRYTLQQTILDSSYRYHMRQIYTLLIKYHGFLQFHTVATKHPDFFQSSIIEFHRLVIIFPTGNKSQLSSFTICFHSHDSKIMLKNLMCAHRRYSIDFIF